MGTLYAAGTKVPVAKSKAEIESVLLRYGATSYASGHTTGSAAVEFVIDGAQYRLKLPFPDPADNDFWQKPNHGGRRKPEEANARFEAEIRRRWRALLLVIKSRLEAAATGISSISEEFAMAAVLPDGRTAAEHVLPMIEQARSSGVVPPVMSALVARPAIGEGESGD